MKKLKIYLDTSIFNFAITSDSPKEQEVTLKFFHQLKQYEIYISEIVMLEINRCQGNKRKHLLDLILKHGPIELKLDQPSRQLADNYIKKGIIPKKYEEDAFHIAIASVNNLDVIVSWNFAHMVKLKTKREVVGVNLLKGYKEIDIYSPWEVVDND